MTAEAGVGGETGVVCTLQSCRWQAAGVEWGQNHSVSQAKRAVTLFVGVGLEATPLSALVPSRSARCAMAVCLTTRVVAGDGSVAHVVRVDLSLLWFECSSAFLLFEPPLSSCPNVLNLPSGQPSLPRIPALELVEEGIAVRVTVAVSAAAAAASAAGRRRAARRGRRGRDGAGVEETGSGGDG